MNDKELLDIYTDYLIRQNLGHADVKTTQDYIGVLDGSTRAPVSVYDASPVLDRLIYSKRLIH